MSDRDDTIHEFEHLVTMTASELEDWLRTDESKAVGQKDGGGESTGHESGRAIVKILRAKKSDYDDHDLEQMTRTISFVKRHLAQRPKGDVEGTPWCASLKNWGHDPTR